MKEPLTDPPASLDTLVAEAAPETLPRLPSGEGFFHAFYGHDLPVLGALAMMRGKGRVEVRASGVRVWNASKKSEAVSIPFEALTSVEVEPHAWHVNHEPVVNVTLHRSGDDPVVLWAVGGSEALWRWLAASLEGRARLARGERPEPWSAVGLQSAAEEHVELEYPRELPAGARAAGCLLLPLAFPSALVGAVLFGSLSVLWEPLGLLGIPGLLVGFLGWAVLLNRSFALLYPPYPVVMTPTRFGIGRRDWTWAEILDVELSSLQPPTLVIRTLEGIETFAFRSAGRKRPGMRDDEARWLEQEAQRRVARFHGDESDVPASIAGMRSGVVEGGQ